MAGLASMSASVAAKTYAQRLQSFDNPAARQLLEIMDRKKSNLAISVDVTKKADLLKVVETVGPDVCMVKVSSIARSHDRNVSRCS